MSTAQTTWHVDAAAVPPGNGSVATPFANLQFALAQSTTVAGDTLLVEPGTYVGVFDFLGKNVTVRSTQGPLVTILDGNLQQVSVVSFVNGEGPTAMLDGFTVRHGRGTPVGPFNDSEGGGIRCVGASPVLTNLVVFENYAKNGSGILLANSSAVVRNSRLASNRYMVGSFLGTSGRGGGLNSSDPNVVVENCTIDGGGGWYESLGGGFYGRATLRDCVFQSNAAKHGGGAYSLGATFERCTFDQNHFAVDFGVDPFGQGGAIAAAGPTIATDCTFSGNHAGLGGAVAALPGASFLVRDSFFFGNRTELPNGPWLSFQQAQGGAAWNVQLEDCELGGNRSNRGGGLFGGSATRCKFYGNTAFAPAPGLGFAYGGAGSYAADLVDCDVFDNVAEPSLNVPSSSSHAQGGGSYLGTATRTRYLRNTADYGGGACGGTITNCTFVDNVATIAGGSMAGAHLTLSPQLASQPPTNVIARNVIAWGGTPNEVATIDTGIAVLTYSDVRGGYAGTGNFALDPRFFAPKTGDVHLKPGSPCIDAGDPTSPLDSDGSRVDVGAFAFVAGWPAEPGTWCQGKTNSLGCVPAIGFSGTPTATGPDNFFVTASNFQGATPGLLVWGRGPNSIPFQGGTLCVKGPFVRAGVQTSTGSPSACDGTYSFPMSQSYRASLGIAAFDTIYAQWIARDPANPDGTGWSLSNAIEFTVLP